MSKKATVVTMTSEQKELLKTIWALKKEIQYPNVDTHGITQQLIVSLNKAEELGMNTSDFPIIEELIEKYIAVPRIHHALARGQGCH